MTDKLMYIPNDDTQNNPFCRLQFVIELNDCKFNLINQPFKLIKVPKVGKLDLEENVIIKLWGLL